MPLTLRDGAHRDKARDMFYLRQQISASSAAQTRARCFDGRALVCCAVRMHFAAVVSVNRSENRVTASNATYHFL